MTTDAAHVKLLTQANGLVHIMSVGLKVNIVALYMERYVQYVKTTYRQNGDTIYSDLLFFAVYSTVSLTNPVVLV